jgi:arabinan endo-1,5-alpha-L-arabinosidase
VSAFNIHTFLRGIVFTIVTATILHAQGSMNTFVHDPVMIKQGTTYYIYYTGNLTPYKSSTSRYSGWKDRGSTFSSGPSWIASTVPANDGRDFWAPDISFRDNKYWLYYSVSTFGKNTSAIGLATSPTLDPSASNYKWTDQGVVVKSSSSNNYNCIDPNAFEDTDGKLWLTFGSFWSGIQLVELDRASGKPVSNAKITTIATRSAGIEAPFLVKWGSYYYLFVSWDKCCDGANSTYKIAVGRSTSVSGPYVDKTGKDMKNGGGVILDQSSDQWKGPGHNGIFFENDTMFCVNHAYAASNGAATLFIRPLYWKDGWPQFQYVPPVHTTPISQTKGIKTPTYPKIAIQHLHNKTSLVAIQDNNLYTIAGTKIKNLK